MSKRSSWLGLLLILGSATAGAESYDIALRNGTLYRGGFELSGIGDVAIRGDRIVAVGQAPGTARREIDVTGLIVAPGFIDLHNHSDIAYQLLGWLPLPESIHANQNFLTQGVTTIVTGNCGSGFGHPDDVKDWFDRVDAMPFGSNVIHLVPHGELRLLVMGTGQLERADPRPSPEELSQMRQLLDASLAQGARGLSSGLAYDPGGRADTDELVALARVAATHGGIYASHTRHEGPDPKQMIASYREAIVIGERAKLPVHVSHIKLAGRGVHGMTDEVIGLVRAARRRGVAVTADQYPYPASSTTISATTPLEFRDGNSVHERYCFGPDREKLLKGIREVMRTETPADGIMISLMPWRWWLQGKTVAEIAADRDEDPAETAADLACSWPAGATYFNQREDDIRRFMTEDWVATASDGTTINPFLGRFIHPRWFGTFPRKIGVYARDEKLITLPFALRSMTELPADAFSISDRGRLEPGGFADVVAFDLAGLRDVSTFDASGRYSEGIRYLLVNGTLSIDEGRYSGRRGGRALRSRGSTD